jgi:hypothetical protein
MAFDLFDSPPRVLDQAPLPRQAAAGQPDGQLVRYGDRFGSIRRLIRSLGRLIAQERRYYRSYRRLAALNNGKLAGIGRTRGDLPASTPRCTGCA